MNTRNQKLVCLLLETVGVAALFLPFTFGHSPWGALQEFWFFAVPALMAPVVLLQTLRSFFLRPLTKPELWLCAALVGLLMLVPLGLYAWDFQANNPTDCDQWPLFLPALLVTGFFMTLKCRGVSAQFLAPLSLRCAYLPNAVYCLLGFSDWGRHWDELQVGAAFVGATAVLYLAEIVYFTRQGLKTRTIG